jgi:DNA-binding response OmpR family regulator
VIDDDATARELIVTHLGGEGFAVETASSFFRHSREIGYPEPAAPSTHHRSSPIRFPLIFA